jgi:hypothetical protein
VYKSGKKGTRRQTDISTLSGNLAARFPAFFVRIDQSLDHEPTEAAGTPSESQLQNYRVIRNRDINLLRFLKLLTDTC